MTQPQAAPPRPVPVRAILATIALVLLTLAGILVVRKLTHVIGLILVAAFFAVVLTPPVDFLVRHRVRRSMATIVVFIVGIAAFVAMMFVFIRPIVKEVNQFVDDFPHLVEDAKAGRGTIGHIVQRYNIDEYVQQHQTSFQNALRNSAAPALDVAKSIASTVFTLVTILVLTFLMILEGPKVTAGFLNMLNPRPRERVSAVASDCAKAMTGYMAGNLIISLIAGVATFAFLSIIRVPFAGVLGLWVAFADLIPLVGATLGAIPTVLVAFLYSPTAGIATIVFYIVYQQFENHVLQTTVMSKSVDLNPLTVLISVLVGVELFGILGALLAIPGAGVIQVVARNLWDEHRGRLKSEPTIGEDEVPISVAAPGKAARRHPTEAGEPDDAPGSEHPPERQGVSGIQDAGAPVGRETA
ncbi:MAG TPA: AI-2E family transporter [Acidimicrobiales bacterium]|nr:AI-2E family transporter [Acidimicrobiales bacterium]